MSSRWLRRASAVLVSLTLLVTFGRANIASAAISGPTAFTADNAGTDTNPLTINATHAAGQFLLAQVVVEGLGDSEVICPPDATWTQVGTTVRNGTNAAQAIF